MATKILKATCFCGRKFNYHPRNPNICPVCKGEVKSDKGKDEKIKHWTAMHVRGCRIIDGRTIYFPNKMEANYFRLLVFLKANREVLDFDYQPPEFDFRPFGITKGIVSYRSDFRVEDFTTILSYFVELKGYIGPDHKTKMNRMRKFYPNIKIKVIDYQAYKELAAQVGKIIPGWEN